MERLSVKYRNLMMPSPPNDDHSRKYSFSCFNSPSNYAHRVGVSTNQVPFSARNILISDDLEVGDVQDKISAIESMEVENIRVIADLASQLDSFKLEILRDQKIIEDLVSQVEDYKKPLKDFTENDSCLLYTSPSPRDS